MRIILGMKMGSNYYRQRCLHFIFLHIEAKIKGELVSLKSTVLLTFCQTRNYMNALSQVKKVNLTYLVRRKPYAELSAFSFLKSFWYQNF